MTAAGPEFSDETSQAEVNDAMQGLQVLVEGAIQHPIWSFCRVSTTLSRAAVVNPRLSRVRP